MVKGSERGRGGGGRVERKQALTLGPTSGDPFMKTITGAWLVSDFNLKVVTASWCHHVTE